MRKRILFMDNQPDFLEVHAKLLERAGYEVLRACTLTEAATLLRNTNVHLALFDIRMEDENDARDISGLRLAQKEEYRSLPKIILTGYPDYEYVREALGITRDGVPPAVNFLSKSEGHEAMIAAVNRAFAEHVRLNWDLLISVKDDSLISLPNIVSLIDPSLAEELMPEHSEELEGLLRRLFIEEKAIRFDRTLWHQRGQVALSVFAFAEGRAHESLVLVCGRRKTSVGDERILLSEFAPKGLSRNLTVLAKSNKTTHFFANAYVLADGTLEETRSLTELYLAGPEKLFHVALRNLFEKAFLDWHQERRVISATQSLGESYRERLGINEEILNAGVLQQRLQALVRQLAILGAKVVFGSQTVTMKFNGLSYCCPDPTTTLYQAAGGNEAVVLMTTPGVVTCDSILVDGNGRTWLTDFAEAGLAPVLWNYVQLEAAIRFDLVECNKLQWLHEMEECLVEGEFIKFNIGEVEQPLRKPLRAIQTIRRLASELVGNDPLPYHLGIFYHAIKRIAEFNPKFQLTPNELARLGHALIAAAMIADQMSANERSDQNDHAVEERGVRVDNANRRVWVNGRSVSLSRQSYELLCALYERPDQLLTRGEIGVRIFGEKYDETEPSHVNRLNTAIFRLRERIEDDPKHPRLLITEPSGGYRLATTK